MQTLGRYFLLPALAMIAMPRADGGETVIERKEFKQSETYPYVFRPVCYLATSGPLPLRFAVSSPECGDRHAPKLTEAAARNPPKSEPPAAPAPAPAPRVPEPEASIGANSGPAPAYPVPTNAPAPKPPTVDFGQFPAELVDAFKKGRDSAEARNYLFDPIFQPALPEELPKSKATYRQK